MFLLDRFTTAFVRVFGITEPTQQQLRRAAWFICGMFALVLCAVAGLVSLLLRLMGR